MPRLIGKQTNSNGYIALMLLAAVGTVGVMEYTGVIDIIPQFGKDYLGQPDLSYRNNLGTLKPLIESQSIAYQLLLPQDKDNQAAHSITQLSILI
jgi:hypothetical protein